MNEQQAALQTAIDKLEALKSKCAGVSCQTLEDQADSALAAIDLCNFFHEIQSDCQLRLVEVAVEAGNAMLARDECEAITCRDELDDALYDAREWAEEHAGNSPYSQRMHGTYSTLRGAVA